MRTPQAPAVLLTAVLVALLAAPADARRERLDLRLTKIELSGAPSAIVSADVDGDGDRDLAVVVAYTEWDQIEIEERTEMDDVEGLVEVLTIVPSLFERRLLQVFLRRGDGTYEPSGPALEINHSVLSLEAGPPGHPVVALTDEGLSSLRLNKNGAPRLTKILHRPPILARTGQFIPGLDLVHDLDGDGRADVLFPAADGALVALWSDDALKPASRVRYPFDPPVSGGRLDLHYPLPEVRDTSGDGLPDLVLPHHLTRWRNFQLFVNGGGGRFEPPRAPLGVYDPDAERPHPDAETRRVVFFGDLDGDGRAEYVTEESLSSEDAGWRKELKQAKRPPFRYRLFRMGEDFSMAGEPYAQFDTLGYAFENEADGDEEVRIPGGLQDLDGDGRLDLVALTLDFTLFQAVRIVTTRSISVGIDFHLWCQQNDGGFRAVEGIDLSGKFRLNLDNLRIGQLSQFAGDFDGDGRADFVQMGRGEKVTIHRGRDGCFYAAEPDLLLTLDDAPKDLGLVKVEDFDGDALADLLVIQPQKVEEAGVTPPVRLDLYMSAGAP